MPTETSTNMENLQRIQNLLVQQQQIQTQYNQIVEELKRNPNQDAKVLTWIKSQLDNLNSTYLQIQSQLQALGYQTSSAPTTKPVEIKSWAKSNFSFKKLAIGGGGLILIIGILFTITINALIHNPQSLTSVGIEASVAKQFISIFAILFLGAFGLVGISFLFSNIYRIITTKNQWKGKFISGILIAIIILGGTGSLAALTFTNINKINTTPPTSFKTPVIPYIIGKDGAKASRGDIAAIAPIEVGFELNQPILNELIASLGEVKIQSLAISCGNEEKQVITTNKGEFETSCFYGRKWNYPISITITYTNILTQEQNLKLEKEMANLSIPAEIDILISAHNKKSVTPLDAKQGEINLWKAPVKVTIDATSAFRDLRLENYEITRDMNNDNIIDRENMTTFDYIYKAPKVYHATFKIPWLDKENFVYSFPLRVEPSDVPICEVEMIPFPSKKTTYKMQTNILDGNLSSISSYHFQVLDIANNKIIKNETSTTRDMDFTFPERGAFLVMVSFITIDGKKGGCESETLQLAQEIITANYSLKQKLTTDTNFKLFSKDAISGGTLTLTEIPTTIQLTLESIIPDSSAVEKNVYLDGKIILNQGNTYEFTINENRTHELNILLEDKERWLSNTIPIQIFVNRPEIEGKLILSPNGGYEPLKVNFNASQSILNDPDDEIIYFTYDFGDGEIKKNLTQWIIDHTYKYNYEKESWIYTPKVTISTRKWKNITFTANPEPNISVRKQLIQIDLSSPSHPTSIARVNDKINFLAEFNGLPEQMNRNFGDNSPEVQCKGRSCYETTYTYSTPGTYTIRLTLQMEDNQTIEKTMTLKVNQK